MSTLISTFREPIRVLIDDDDPDIQLRENAQIDAAVRLVVNLGKVVSEDGATAYALDGTTSITPNLTATGDAHAWARLVWNAAKRFTSAAKPMAWRTRAFSETIGEGREKVFEVLEELWNLENGGGCKSSDYA